MSVSITDPIFISIGCIKLPLFEQKLETCAIPLREKFVRMGKVLFAIFYSRSKIREIAFHDKNIVTPWERWLNRARVARCKQPQRALIEKAKTSSHAKCQYLSLLTWFSFQSVALNWHSFSKNWELVLPSFEKNWFDRKKFRNFTIFYRETKLREIAFHDKDIVTPWERWLNSARVAPCQRPQRPPIKKAKTSSPAKCP